MQIAARAQAAAADLASSANTPSTAPLAVKQCTHHASATRLGRATSAPLLAIRERYRPRAARLGRNQE